MSSAAWLFRRSIPDFANAAASSEVKNSLFAYAAGRSSGVNVAFDQLPVRSGWPSAVRAVQAFGFAGAAADGGAGDWAPGESDAIAASTAITARWDDIGYC